MKWEALPDKSDTVFAHAHDGAVIITSIANIDDTPSLVFPSHETLKHLALAQIGGTALTFVLLVGIMLRDERMKRNESRFLDVGRVSNNASFKNFVLRKPGFIQACLDEEGVGVGEDEAAGSRRGGNSA